MRNPYIVDRPLDDQDLFIGRSAILDDLQRGLAEEQRLFVIYGKPRIGKTSLLAQLGLRLGGAYHVVPLPWPGLGNMAPLARLWQILEEAVGAPASRPELASSSAANADDHRARLTAMRQEPPVLVCLDGVPLTDLADRAAWEEALQALRLALRPSRGLALALTIEARPAQVGLEHGQIAHYVLERFTTRETEDLLMTPVRGEMTYDLDAAAQIQRFAGGEPHFVQLFGRELFEARSRRGWVDVPEVGHAADQVLALGASHFQALWEESSWPARIVLCVFGERVGTDGVATAADIGNYLRQLRIDMATKEISEALTELVHRDLLEMLGGRTYRFINALFLRWIKREKNTLDTVRASRAYHQRRLEPSSSWSAREVDWMSMALWALAIALALGVGYVWRGRELIVRWTAQPTPPATLSATSATSATSAPTAPLPTPPRGVAPGRIVYMAKTVPEDKWAIFVMRSDGTDPQQLTGRHANDTAPIWSPAGRNLLFVSDRDGNREIYLMSAEGSSQLNLTRHPAEDWTPCWSPDGQQVAFASFRDENWEIYVMAADGSNPRRLTRSPAADYAPTWSPDGERIAFVSDRSGNLDIWTMAPDGSGLSQFTSDPATDQSPAWSPDSKQIAWESYRSGNMEIYVADVAGSEPRNLSQDAYADDHGVTWSPWGDQVAYYSNRDRGWDIITLDLNSGQRTNITQSDDYEQAPNWGH